MNSQYKLIRWNTVLSDCQNLYFEELADKGKLIITVKDSADVFFEIVVEQKYLYQVVDEEYLTKYWNQKSSEIGWTFMVQSSDWPAQFPGVLELCDDYIQHYVIATWDYCIEVLSNTAPIICQKGTL